MTVQQLFEAIGNIDDRFIDEAASDAIPHVKWKIAGVAAAAAVVIAATVLYSTAMLNRPTAPPQDLAAPTPVVTAAPTQPPAPEVSNPVYITPEDEPEVTESAQPQPDSPDSPGGWSAGWPSLPGSGGSGSGALPGFPLPGSGMQGSDPPGSESNLTEPSNPTYIGRYSHTPAGDFIVFVDSQFGIPVLTKNITGQITDGHYAATVYGFPFGQSRYVELQVHADGSYDLTVS